MVNICLIWHVGGAEAVYFCNKFRELRILGIDYVPNAFEYFNSNINDALKGRIRLESGDWYNLDSKLKGCFDGVISLETLSWLEEWKKPIDCVIDINPKWMAFSSLFYDGRINYTIRIEDYEESQSEEGYDVSFYNIYSIPIIRDYLAQCGYTVFHYKRFDIDIDLPKPLHKGTETYTLKSETGDRLMISAAMLMPWYFIYAERE